MHDAAQLRDELHSVANQARERRSVEAFTRAALEGFLCAVLAGISLKMLRDSARVPVFFYPLALVELLLLWDAARQYAQARARLRLELQLEARLRRLRARLGIDP